MKFLLIPFLFFAIHANADEIAYLKGAMPLVRCQTDADENMKCEDSESEMQPLQIQLKGDNPKLLSGYHLFSKTEGPLEFYAYIYVMRIIGDDTVPFYYIYVISGHHNNFDNTYTDVLNGFFMLPKMTQLNKVTMYNYSVSMGTVEFDQSVALEAIEMSQEKAVRSTGPVRPYNEKMLKVLKSSRIPAKVRTLLEKGLRI